MTEIREGVPCGRGAVRHWLRLNTDYPEGLSYLNKPSEGICSSFGAWS